MLLLLLLPALGGRDPCGDVTERPKPRSTVFTAGDVTDWLLGLLLADGFEGLMCMWGT